MWSRVHGESWHLQSHTAICDCLDLSQNHLSHCVVGLIGATKATCANALHRDSSIHWVRRPWLVIVTTRQAVQEQADIVETIMKCSSISAQTTSEECANSSDFRSHIVHVCLYHWRLSWMRSGRFRFRIIHVSMRKRLRYINDCVSAGDLLI